MTYSVCAPHNAARIQELREATTPFGFFTAADAAEHGIRRSILRRYLQNGALLRNVFNRSVYRLYTPAENESIVDVALMTRREAIASHSTALRLHNLTDLLSDTDEFTLQRSRRSRRPPAPLKFFTSRQHRCSMQRIAFVVGVHVTTRTFTGERGTIDRRSHQIEREIARVIERRLATRVEVYAAVER